MCTDEARLADTPVGYAELILQDEAACMRSGIRPSEPARRQAMLARAYLEALDDLRRARNSYRAMQISHQVLEDQARRLVRQAQREGC